MRKFLQASLLGPNNNIPHPAVGNADDILIVSSGPVNNRLNEYLEGLGEYFLKWTLNLTKDCSSHVQRNYEVYLTELQNLYSILVEGGEKSIGTSNEIFRSYISQEL